MTDDPPRETIAAYDRYAREFRDRKTDRSSVARGFPLFAALLPEGGLVLDAGCGPGMDRPRLLESGSEVIGMDRSAGMVIVRRKYLVSVGACLDGFPSGYQVHWASCRSVSSMPS